VSYGPGNTVSVKCIIILHKVLILASCTYLYLLSKFNVYQTDKKPNSSCQIKLSAPHLMFWQHDDFDHKFYCVLLLQNFVPTHVLFSEMKSKMGWRKDILSYAVLLRAIMNNVMVHCTEFISHEENVHKIFQKSTQPLIRFFFF